MVIAGLIGVAVGIGVVAGIYWTDQRRAHRRLLRRLFAGDPVYRSWPSYVAPHEPADDEPRQAA